MILLFLTHRTDDKLKVAVDPERIIAIDEIVTTDDRRCSAIHLDGTDEVMLVKETAEQICDKIRAIDHCSKRV